MKELNIIKHERIYHKNSKDDDDVDTSNNPPLLVTTTLTESNNKQDAEHINKNASKVTTSNISFDSNSAKSNF